MVDGPRVHSEQSVALEHHRVQYRKRDVERPAYVEEGLVFHRAPLLFRLFFLEYNVLLETSENDTISRVKAHHNDRHHDTQHSTCLADYHKSSLFPWA
jgi:hypothetical protein